MWEIWIHGRRDTLYRMRLMDFSEGEARAEFAENVREFIPKGAEYASLTWRNEAPLVTWHEGDDVPEVDWDEFCPHGHRQNPCDECEYELEREAARYGNS